MHPCGRVAFARVFSSHSIRVAAPRRYHRSTVNKTVSMAPMHYSPVLSGLRASVYIRRNFVSNIQSESEIRPASFPRKGGNFPGIYTLLLPLHLYLLLGSLKLKVPRRCQVESLRKLTPPMYLSSRLPSSFPSFLFLDPPPATPSPSSIRWDGKKT